MKPFRVWDVEFNKHTLVGALIVFFIVVVTLLFLISLESNDQNGLQHKNNIAVDTLE